MTSHDNLRTHIVFGVQGFSSGRSCWEKNGVKQWGKTRTFCIAGNFGAGNIFRGLCNFVGVGISIVGRAIFNLF